MIQLIHAKQSQSPDCSFYTPLMMGPQNEKVCWTEISEGAMWC